MSLSIFLCTTLLALAARGAAALTHSNSRMRIIPSRHSQREGVKSLTYVQQLSSTSTDDSLDGAIEPMKVVIDKGFKVGKSIKNGVFQEDVNPDDIPPEEVQSLLIEEASANLMNIDINERNRRRNIGNVGAGLTAMLYGALIVTHVPLFTRTLALFFPVSLSYGFRKSGDEGL